MLFGETLRKLREEKGLSQKQLGKQVFVNHSTIARWENSSRLPDTTMIIRLAQCLGVDVNTLFQLANQSDESPNVILVDDSKAVLSDALTVLGEVMPNATITGFIWPAEAIEYARYYQRDVLIIDTAGRLHIDQELMDELLRIREAVHPQEILLTVDAMTGQDAVNVAKAFDEKLDVTGVILTKLDGDTRGGAALSIKAVTGKPIKFSGTGEKLTDIEPFHPDRMAGRILGMGDVLTLIDKATEAFDEKDAEKFARRGMSSKLTLEDFLEQMQSMKKMGGIKSMLGMIPGMSGKDIDVDDNALKKPEAIIRSMTPKERRDPSVLNASRRKRIAAGSGTTVQDVNQLIRQFEQTQQMMKQMMGAKGRKSLRNLRFPGM